LNSKGSFVVPAQIFFFFLCYDHCQQRSMRDLFPAKESLPSLSLFAALADCLSVSIEKVSFRFSDCSVSSYSSSSAAAAAA
jgi:hypothetical protein